MIRNEYNTEYTYTRIYKLQVAEFCFAFLRNDEKPWQPPNFKDTKYSSEKLWSQTF